ncbi:unnamed protein product [Ostreobium quekettii]|uniref:Serpin domain-containing protein n=1 Tax=Ostreobium quekettii TaxID=121088 RepID=A0A8S1J545_9CHLO|nr:unnamed protein product [Ostreobium quekettii]
MCTAIPRSGWLLAVALLALAAGSQAQPGVQQLNSLALDLFDEIYSQDESKNIFFSPLSIATAYSLLHIGAEGDTKEQLESVFGFGAEGVSGAFLNPYSGLITEDESDDVDVLQSSILYIEEGFAYKPAFKIRLTKNPTSRAAEKVPFATDPEAARKEINKNVSTLTMGYIEDMLPEGSVDELTRMVVVNAVFFKGGWMEPFKKEDTVKLPFAAFDKKNATVDMMIQKETWLRLSLTGSILDAQVLELPYGNGAASMVIILPSKPGRNAFLEVAAQLREVDFTDLVNSLQSTMVNVYLPKFEIEASTDLGAVLPPLGVTDLFQPDSSDLSGMSDAVGLYVSSSLHKARVKVDEKGTTAAASTAAVARATSLVLPTDFRADHPFMYFIIDAQSKAIMFMGSVQGLPMGPVS